MARRCLSAATAARSRNEAGSPFEELALSLSKRPCVRICAARQKCRADLFPGWKQSKNLQNFIRAARVVPKMGIVQLL